MSYQLVGDFGLSCKIGVILPTYGEAENITNLIKDIQNLNLDASILVIDDSSPDNTAEVVKELQKKNSNLFLCIRPKKSGLGTAITDGFRIYLSLLNKPKYVITMDADYSHDPKEIPALLSKVDERCGLVIGSRYCKGGKTAGWPFTRKIISRTANLIARSSLGLKLHDCTSGFRCYSTDFLKVAISNLHSQTYEIQIETIRQAAFNHFQIKESPILFVNRKRGKSKLTLTEIKSYLTYTFKAAPKNV